MDRTQEAMLLSQWKEWPLVFSIKSGDKEDVRRAKGGKKDHRDILGLA